jgi:dihydropteroate synthase
MSVIRLGERSMSGSLPTPRLRAFTWGSEGETIDELQVQLGSDAPATAPYYMPAAVKLWLPADALQPVMLAVRGFPTIACLGPSRVRDEATLLLVGSVKALEECATTLSQGHGALATLASGMRQQLAHLYPRAYGRLSCRGHVLDFSAKTGVMGILNVTPDSFYDGGRYVDVQAALERAHQMVEEGADIIDIGGQSSRPGSDPVSEAEERHRLLPVVSALAASLPVMISVDTYRASIAREALEAGAHLINDISALRFDPDLLPVVAAHAAPLILMHMKGLPRDMQLNPRYDALIDEVFAFLHERLDKAQAGGVPAERLLIDPGIGFGKGAQHNLELLRKLHHFLALGQPIVVGTSRKSFIGRILGTEADERLEGTAATVAVSIMHGASIIRVHDVRAMARVARMMDAMLRPNFRITETGGHLHPPGDPTRAV